MKFGFKEFVPVIGLLIIFPLIGVFIALVEEPISKVIILGGGVAIILYRYWLKNTHIILSLVLLFCSTIPLMDQVNVIHVLNFDIRLWELLALFAWAIFIVKTFAVGLLRSKFDWVIIAVMSSILLASIYNFIEGIYSFNKIILFIFRNVVAGWGMYFLVKQLVTKSSYKRFLWIFLGLGVFTSLAVIIVETTRSQFLFWLLFPGYADMPMFADALLSTNMRLTSIFGVGIVLASMSVSISLFFLCNNKLEQTFALLSMIILLLHNLLSASRGLLVISAGLFFVIFFYSSSFRKLNKQTLYLLISSVFVVIIVVGAINTLWEIKRDLPLVKMLTNRFTNSASSESDARRSYITAYALRKIPESPLFGLGVYGLDPVKENLSSADVNGFVNIAFSYGAIGSFSFIWLFIMLLEFSISTIKKNKKIEIDEYIIRTSVIATFFAYSLYTFSGQPFNWWPAPLAVLIGLYEVI